jgi:hypothetical protein
MAVFMCSPRVSGYQRHILIHASTCAEKGKRKLGTLYTGLKKFHLSLCSGKNNAIAMLNLK